MIIRSCNFKNERFLGEECPKSRDVRFRWAFVKSCFIRMYICAADNYDPLLLHVSFTPRRMIFRAIARVRSYRRECRIRKWGEENEKRKTKKKKKTVLCSYMVCFIYSLVVVPRYSPYSPIRLMHNIHQTFFLRLKLIPGQASSHRSRSSSKNKSFWYEQSRWGCVRSRLVSSFLPINNKNGVCTLRTSPAAPTSFP